jgi:hypothetical protein
MKNTIYTLIFLFAFQSVYGQISFTNGDHSLEISGSFSGYYNHRFLKSGEVDQKKNRYRLRDAQIQLEGRYRNTIEYELQVDFADLALGNSGPIDPENPRINGCLCGI